MLAARANDLPFGSWDGHTHTRLCPHGSKEATRSFVEAALERGFQRISLTEHAPLPKGFEDRAPERDSALPARDLGAYLDEAEELRTEYEGRIEVCVGLEVDWLPGYEAETRALLDHVGPRLQDALLSIHFLRDERDWHCIDHSTENLRFGWLADGKDPEASHAAYWDSLALALRADLGPFKPRRIGHLTLMRKFHAEVGAPDPDWTRARVEPLLLEMAERGIELDWNGARVNFAPCAELMPTPDLALLARDLGIGMVYGSDAHAVRGIGQGLGAALEAARSIDLT